MIKLEFSTVAGIPAGPWPWRRGQEFPFLAGRGETRPILGGADCRAAIWRKCGASFLPATGMPAWPGVMWISSRSGRASGRRRGGAFIASGSWQKAGAGLELVVGFGAMQPETCLGGISGHWFDPAWRWGRLHGNRNCVATLTAKHAISRTGVDACWPGTA